MVVKYRQLTQSLIFLETLNEPTLRAPLAKLTQALADAWKARDKVEGQEGELSSWATPTFHTYAVDLLQKAGVVVSSGVLKEVFNLELLLFPWNEAGLPEAGVKPIVILLEGRGHYFSNRPTQLTGDAEFRFRMVKRLKEGRFEKVLRLTVQEWRQAKGRGGKFALIKERLTAEGVEISRYLPPPGWVAEEREGESIGVGAMDGVGVPGGVRGGVTEGEWEAHLREGPSMELGRGLGLGGLQPPPIRAGLGGKERGDRSGEWLKPRRRGMPPLKDRGGSTDPVAMETATL